MRNRIISGLSDKILVVEATNTSGSIITANLAIEQGKNVYAIPGNITSTKSSGTNELIKDGAILVSSIEDVINL
jgi:DNA processing protein